MNFGIPTVQTSFGCSTGKSRWSAVSTIPGVRSAPSPVPPAGRAMAATNWRPTCSTSIPILRCTAPGLRCRMYSAGYPGGLKRFTAQDSRRRWSHGKMSVSRGVRVLIPLSGAATASSMPNRCASRPVGARRMASASSAHRRCSRRSPRASANGRRPDSATAFLNIIGSIPTMRGFLRGSSRFPPQRSGISRSIRHSAMRTNYSRTTCFPVKRVAGN